MRAVLASQNKKKLCELQEILSAQGVELLLQSQLGVKIEVEETGMTFEENARLKAEAVCCATGLPAIADDSGLVVDALDGAPGIFSARYGGPGLDDEGRWRLLLCNMEGVRARNCRFVCVICCAFPNGDCLFARGECEGIVADAPRGQEGFGYDPVFQLPDGRHMAELSSAEKNTISHRALALRAVQTEWETYQHGTEQ